MTDEPPSALTDRQLEVARLVAEGYTDKQIAGKLEMAQNTVRVHVAAIVFRLGFQCGDKVSRILIARWWWKQQDEQAA